MSSHLLSAETVYSEHPEPGTDNSLTGIREMATMFAEFNRVDSSRCFGFSSGLPASFGVSISELQAGNRHLTENLRRRIFIEFLKALITIVFPIKNLALALRTAARYGYCRTSRQASGSHSALISVGPEAKRDDKYFGRLASHLEDIEYTKIVQGFRVKPEADYDFLEGKLRGLGLLKVFISVFLLTPLMLIYIFITQRLIADAKTRQVYCLMALTELASSSVFATNIICNSLKSYAGRKGLVRVTFPFEGRTWEKRLVSACKERKVVTVGYLHCALTPRHVPLIFPELFYNRAEIPDTIITPGQMPYQFLSRSFGGEAEIVKGCFLRGCSNHLVKHVIDENKIILALTGGLDEARRILALIAKSEALKKFKVIVKPNPSTSTYATIKNLLLSLNLSDEDEDTNKLPFLCFFRSSSVAIDYLRRGVCPCYLRLEGEISNCTFDLDGHYPASEILLDVDFDSQFMELLHNIEAIDPKDGLAVSDYYLDQAIDPNKLKYMAKLMVGHNEAH